MNSLPIIPQEKSKNEFLETVSVVMQAVCLAIGVQFFAYQPFYIPSSSMYGTLLIGDYLAVSKFSYGYSWASWPVSIMQPLNGILPSGRVFGSEPKRGDVVVFKPSGEPHRDYIKRLIGMPGDTVQMRDGVVILNGKAIQKAPAGYFLQIDNIGREKKIARFEETLPEGQKYFVLDERNSEVDNTPVFKVPQGHYFMMGDNRDNSQDSRYPFPVAFVSFDHLVGRADRIIVSVSNQYSAWDVFHWGDSMRTERFFTEIK